MTDASASGRLGRFHLVEPMGSGPCGDVFRAKVYGVAGFERQFAVKRFYPALMANPQYVAALSVSSRASAALEHPRIGKLVEFGVSGGDTFAATELCDGVDLQRLLISPIGQRVSLLPGAALAIIAQAARAIGYAHGRGIAHLGLSPTNLIVSDEGNVRVTDFGILAACLPAKPAHDERLRDRVPYLAPEQLVGDAAGPPADVFVLGTMACEFIAGSLPFLGDNPVDIAQAIVAGQFTEPNLPRPLLRVLQRCLARAPHERFPDARTLADSIDAALRLAPVLGGRPELAKLVIDSREWQSNQRNELSGMFAMELPVVARVPTGNRETRLERPNTSPNMVSEDLSETIPFLREDMPDFELNFGDEILPTPATASVAAPVLLPQAVALARPPNIPSAPPRLPSLPPLRPRAATHDPSAVPRSAIPNIPMQIPSVLMPAAASVPAPVLRPISVPARPSQPAEARSLNLPQFESDFADELVEPTEASPRAAADHDDDDGFNDFELELSAPLPVALGANIRTITEDPLASPKPLQAIDPIPALSVAEALPTEVPLDDLFQDQTPAASPPARRRIPSAPPVEAPRNLVSAAPRRVVQHAETESVYVLPSSTQGSGKGWLLAIAVLVVAAGAGGFGYWKYSQSSTETVAEQVAQPATTDAQQNLGDARPVDNSQLGSAGSATPVDNGGKTGSDSVALVPTPDAQPAVSSRLQITSVPTGATVFLDGAPLGVTPLDLPGTADTHSLAVMLAGHALYLKQISGTGETQVPLTALVPSGLYGGIKVLCKTPDRYYIYVDGVDTGMMCPTDRIAVSVGRHTVEIYDLVTETRREVSVKVTGTRASARVRGE